MKLPPTLNLLKQLNHAKLPMVFTDAPAVDRLMAYQTAGFVRLVPGPKSTALETYGRLNDVVIVEVTRAGRLALGLA